MTRKRSRVPRLFLQESLSGKSIEVRDRDAHYLRHVLRLRAGDPLVLFNGQGDERHATVERSARDSCALILADATDPLPESPLRVSLVQAIAKSEAMDLIVQKATELGADKIFPVTTDFSVVRLEDDRAARRTQHWQKIANSACEQSGRHRPPIVHSPQKLPAALESLSDEGLRVLLDPESATLLSTLLTERQAATKIVLMIGPEGGLSPTERGLLERSGFVGASLGPRTLRTETAAIISCAMAQGYWGDLGIRKTARPASPPLSPHRE